MIAAVALIVVIIGVLVYMIPIQDAKIPNKLVGIGVTVVGVALVLMNAVVIIGVGEAGAQHFLGDVKPDVLSEGVHVINPLASVERMSIREQSFPAEGRVEQIEAQTSEQLNVTVEVSIIYKILSANVPRIYEEIGSETTMEQAIVLNSLRNGVRDAVATKSINEIFSPERHLLALAIREEIQAKAEDRIEVETVFVRDIQAPSRVREAIEQKQEREQQVAAEEFQTQIIQERARQQAEEAKGIAEAQRIISQGLTQEYLTFYYIQQLAEMPEGSLVYVPTEGGIPLIRNLGGGR